MKKEKKDGFVFWFGVLMMVISMIFNNIAPMLFFIIIWIESFYEEIQNNNLKLKSKQITCNNCTIIHKCSFWKLEESERLFVTKNTMHECPNFVSNETQR